VISWLFLAVSVLGALFTINAFWPVKRNRVLFVPSFFASWLTIELGWVHIVWEMVATAVFIWFGALRSWPGWVGLGICVLNWLALTVTVVKSRRSEVLADEALAPLGPEPAAESRRPLEIRRIKDVEFARVGGRSLKLDVFTPVEPGTNRPALLQIHGGAWIIGDKREQGIPLQKLMASQGWVCFNANYRLSPAATWPEHLVDVKRALVWIRAHAEEYGIDPSYVAVTGGSAGGHLTAMMALTANDPDYQPGFEQADTSLQAAVPFYGVYDFCNRNDTMPPEFLKWIAQPMIMKAFLEDEPERFHAASPFDLVRADAPPFFVIHGDNDTLAPVADAREFVERLRAVSREPVCYLELHGAQHAFDIFPSVRTRRVIRSVHRFLATVHAGHDGRAVPGAGSGPVAAIEPADPSEILPETPVESARAPSRVGRTAPDA